MADEKTIQLVSNVKIITSGNAPTVANLLPGQAAFGKITADGKYHLYGNTGEGGGTGRVVDLVLDSLPESEAQSLQKVLEAGNWTTVDMMFKEASTGETEDGSGTTKLTIGKSGIIGEAFSILNDGNNAFKDHNKPVLSAYTDLTLTADDAAQMRTHLSIYSKAEVDAKLGGALHMKGSVEAFANLPTEASVGDVYNVKTAGGTDIHGNAIKAGDNVVWVEANGDDPAGWDVLSGVVDLTSYYTKDEVDGIKTALEEAIQTAQTQADKGVADAAAAKTAADTAQAAAEAAQADIDALKQTVVTTGDGTKVLTDNGTYQTLELSVIAI